MKKRLMAGLLAAVMLLTLLSGGALALGESNERLEYTASKYADAKGTSSNGKPRPCASGRAAETAGYTLRFWRITAK